MRAPGPRRRVGRLLLAIIVAGLASGAPSAAAPLPAQQVELRGASDVAIDRRLARLVAADPLVLSRDTLVPAGDTLAGPVLVLGSTIILEGTIRGDLVMVQGGAFLRPRAAVSGDVVNIAGGIYRSDLARIGGTILDLPTAPYRVVREDDRFIIEATATASRIVLDGVGGFHIPTYDRVNGLTAVWGAGYRLPRLGPVTPVLHAQAGWQTQRGEPTYAVDLSAGWVGYTLAVGHERAWDTNERWIRGDFPNSLNYLWNGRDYRDYHEVERSWAQLTRAFGDREKRLHGAMAARLQIEDGTSLAAGAPWHIWDREVRPNPPIDAGRLTSAIGELRLSWDGLLTAAEARVLYEQGIAALDGQAEFRRVVVDGDVAMAALGDHTLAVELYLQAVPGGGTLPRQRWSFVGGSGTLQTLPFAGFDGDRVVFVETQYIIPFPPRLTLPVLGAPALHLVHAAGMAWEAEEPAELRQEVGLRLQFFGLYLRYMVEPGDPSNNDFDVGISWPFGGSHRWER